MRTVAIVGSHIRTREAAPWDQREVEIWVINEAASAGWPKRVDAVFQMHKRAVWDNPQNRNDPNFPAWMRVRHSFPVYMQETDVEVPSSKKFPLKGVCLELLSRLWKGKQRVRFFTSTPAFMLALAIHQGYRRIELYGIEMQSDTEYTYQREGVFFWLGVAVGKGVEVVVHEESTFFTEPLYGYEGDVTLKMEDLQKRAAKLEGLRKLTDKRVSESAKKRAEMLEEAVNGDGTEPGLESVAMTRKYFEAVKEEAEATIDWAKLEGALSETGRYLAKMEAMKAATGDYFIARQEFEITASMKHEEYKQRQAHMHAVGGQASAAWKEIEKAIHDEAPTAEVLRLAKDYEAVHMRYLAAARECGLAAGIVNENAMLGAQTDELIKAAGGTKAEEAMLSQRGNGRVVFEPSEPEELEI